MNLDERLHAAREEYRQLGSRPAEDDLADVLGAPRTKAPWVLSAAAVVVVAAVVAVLLWRDPGSTSGPAGPVDTDPSITVTIPDGPPAQGDSEPLVPDPNVQLDQSGPFQDGQQVELSVPSGFTVDWMNEWPRMCSEVLTSAGRITSCDHVQILNAEPGYDGVSTGEVRDERIIRLSRRVFTPVGYRDCNEEEVSCRIVVRRADGAAAASDRLEFVGDASVAGSSLQVTEGSSPGRFLVTPSGVEPNQAWIDEYQGQPTGSGVPAFSVSVCGFGEGDPAVGPTGGSWNGQVTPWAGRPGLGVNCDTFDPRLDVIDPRDPNSAFEIDLTHPLFGYGGWTDCRVQACYVAVTPTYTDSTGSSYDASAIVAARLPLDGSAPMSARPSLRIVEPGPYTQGQVLTVEVADLPGDVESMIAICRVDAGAACGYLMASVGSGAGPRSVTLLGSLEGCGLDGCYLALGSTGEGLPPPATVPLPVDETTSPSG